jgi:transcriptional regulator GlxA family with amidase domain
MLLAEAGILAGRPAITHHTALEDLRGFGADVRVGERFVDDGDIVTAAGVTSGIDMALHLVGPRAAAAVAEEIEWSAQISGASTSGRSTGTNEYESSTSTKVAARN